MFVFGLYSTSDDWPSNLNDESHLKCKKMVTKSSKNVMFVLDYIQKCEKMAIKSSKNEMFIFGLCSTSDDQLSNPSDKSCPKCKKKMAAKLSKNEMQFMHPLPRQDGDGTGMVWEHARDGTGTGQEWARDGTGMGWDDIGGFHADGILPH